MVTKIKWRVVKFMSEIVPIKTNLSPSVEIAWILEKQLTTSANFFVGQSNAILSTLYSRDFRGRTEITESIYIQRFFRSLFFSLLSIGGIIGSPPFYSRCGSEIIESFRIYRINRINLVDGMWSLLIRQCGVITGGHKTDEQCLQWECALNYSQNTPPATSECLFPET